VRERATRQTDKAAMIQRRMSGPDKVMPAMVSARVAHGMRHKCFRGAGRRNLSRIVSFWKRCCHESPASQDRFRA
jgi:hypothetical protein